MAVKRKITKKELTNRLALVLLGLFAAQSVEPVRNWIETNINVNPFLVGVVGMLIVLWYFDLE